MASTRLALPQPDWRSPFLHPGPGWLFHWARYPCFGLDAGRKALRRSESRPLELTVAWRGKAIIEPCWPHRVVARVEVGYISTCVGIEPVHGGSGQLFLLPPGTFNICGTVRLKVPHPRHEVPPFKSPPTRVRLIVSNTLYCDRGRCDRGVPQSRLSL